MAMEHMKHIGPTLQIPGTTLGLNRCDYL